MSEKSLRACVYSGCPNLVKKGYCEQHKKQSSEYRRGTARQRGYTTRWNNYSKWFLRQEGNQTCKLRLDDGCSYKAECVDHIKPPSNANDPLFWDGENHQAACIHCNSVKGNKEIKGKW